MALYDDPAAEALNLPAPPERMTWRVVRLAAVRAICTGKFAEIADECMTRQRILYPKGSFNPRVTGDEASETIHAARVIGAQQTVPLLDNFHPGFPEIE